MKIVARQGRAESPNAYLIEVGNGLGQVVSMFMREKYKPFNIQSIGARGYWEEHDNDQELMERILSFPEEKSE